MSRVMSSSWKKTDTFAQAVFQELYKEGKEVYKHDIAEYKMALSSEVKRGSSNDVYSQQHGNISGPINRANIQESTNHEASRRGSATNSSSIADDNSMSASE